MALQAREFFDSASRGAQPRLIPSKVKVLTLAAGTALLPIGTPLAYNTSTNFWVPFTQGGSNGTDVIGAILYEDPIQLVAGGEVQCVALWEGEVHRDDVNTAAIRAVLGGPPSEAQLDTALRAATLRYKGIHVTNLTQVL